MNIPIVTLDKIYITPDEENIYFLDCTRVDGSNEIISRKNESLDVQIKRLSRMIGSSEIILADDIVFSGSVLKNIIGRFNAYGIKVVGIISSICTRQSYEYFNLNLKYGIRTNFILEDDVIDQICERDFYFGIAGSGIAVSIENGLYKAPYFEPYGDPCERASIPVEYVKYFSSGCLDRSVYLWNEIDFLKGEKTLIGELPERIVDTTSSQEVVKTLRKARKSL